MNFSSNDPIIKSLLDTDFYKFTMGQLIWKNYSNQEVEFKLINRSNAPLAKFINEIELRMELDHVKRLKFNNSELHYLRGTNEYGERMFCEPYLDFLKNLELPNYDLKRDGDTFQLSFTGPWASVTYWEIPAMAIVNELYYRGMRKGLNNFIRNYISAIGVNKLHRKIEELKKRPEITISDFGTRRRFRREWHSFIVESLTEELPNQFRGTSNVMLAMKYGLLPMGTSAHELPMVISAIRLAEKKEGQKEFDIMIQAQREVLIQWLVEYGEALSIALTDTFGTDFFMTWADKDIATDWKGLRQDSGDPWKFANRAINWYEFNEVDPKTKMIIFSDQLDINLILGLHETFKGKIGHTFGIGTNLTNDVGYDPISIVIKASKVNGYPTVKLSDNLAKAIGPIEEIKRYKEAVGYTNKESKECIS